MPTPPRSRREAGFTLIELSVALVLFGIIVGIAVGPYMRYQRAQQHAGVTRRIVAALRSAQVSAVSENATYRVDFAPSSLTVHRKPAGSSTWTQTAVVTETESVIEIGSTTFTQADGTVSPSCYFYARGTASPTPAGTGLVISRTDSDKEYRIQVEGLTARVFYESVQ